MLRRLPAQDRRSTAWKNGQGQTAEIAIHPPGADLSAFDWRVSLAQVAVSGPFSKFPGVDRWLLVLTGTMDLAIDGAAPLRLQAGGEPIRFPGDVPVQSTVRDGPVRDLNIMTARDRVLADIRRLKLAAGGGERLAGAALVLCLSGAVRVSDGADAADLSALDAAWVDGAAEVAALGPCEMVVTRFGAGRG
jgi:hypothetical protein